MVPNSYGRRASPRLHSLYVNGLILTIRSNNTQCDRKAAELYCGRRLRQGRRADSGKAAA